MLWKTACLASLLLIGCEFGSESGSSPRRLWRLPLAADIAVPWTSDAVALAMDGDSLLAYRMWNGCYRRIAKFKASEFFHSDSFETEVVHGAQGDSLRVTYSRDGVGSVTFGEIRGACQSDRPIGKVTVKSSDLDGGSFGLLDSLRVTLEYEYTPEAGDARTYYLGLNFQDASGDFAALGRDVILAAPTGTVRIAFAAGNLPPQWMEPQPIGYSIHIGFVRSPNQNDKIFNLPYRPVKASYRPDP